MSSSAKILYDATKPRDVCGEICDAGYSLVITRGAIGMYNGAAIPIEGSDGKRINVSGVTTWSITKEIWEMIYE